MYVKLEEEDVTIICQEGRKESSIILGSLTWRSRQSKHLNTVLFWTMPVVST
jgi:hypothetical protein